MQVTLFANNLRDDLFQGHRLAGGRVEYPFSEGRARASSRSRDPCDQRAERTFRALCCAAEAPRSRAARLGLSCIASTRAIPPRQITASNVKPNCCASRRLSLNNSEALSALPTWHSRLPSRESVMASALATRKGYFVRRNEAALASSNTLARSRSPCARKASDRVAPKALPNSRDMASACSLRCAARS